MRCFLQALILLHLVYETTHAPSGVCPSEYYCSPCNRSIVICRLDSLMNITELLSFGPTFMPIDNLMINGCANLDDIPRNINVKNLKLNCSNHKRFNQSQVLLFNSWFPYLETITNGDFVYSKTRITANQTCRSVCKNTIVRIKNSSSCICITQNDGDNSINSTYLYNNQSIKNKTTNVETFNFHHLLAIGSVSLLCFLVNFILLTTICVAHKTTLIDVFGIALMIFNILLSLYGVALTVYLSQSHTDWHPRFCQGFTSIKLFALGASVWTLMMLTFHRKVRGDIDDDSNEEDKKEDKEREKEEKEKKKKETDAIFKGIVYILEGLMLSGVLAVMSWIKLDRWESLCIVFEPRTTVDWLLTGIELLHYFIAFCLILRFPYNLIRKQRKPVSNELVHKKKRDKGRDKSHTIFIMVFISFIIWVTGYIMTLPRFGLFTDKLRRVIRICALIFPPSIQPIIYVLRNTCCCLCRNPPCKKKREKESDPSEQCVLLVCECTGSERCPACEPEFLEKYGNTQFNEKKANGGTQKKKKKSKQNKKDKDKKKKKKRKNDVIEPKSIERSPILKQRDISFDDAVAETPLLKNDNAIEAENSPSHFKNVPNFPTDSTPLLDDVDGSKQPPKATSDDTPVKVAKSGVTTEFPSFISMESAIDVDSLPKEKPPNISKLTTESFSLDEEGRKSRGPTFFPLADKKNSAEEKNKNKLKKKNQKGTKNNHEPDKKKVKRRKSKEKIECNSATTNNERNSTISLEWDHYSDSSGSISRGSDCFPDELVVSSPDIDINKQTNCNHQNNGISTKKQETNDSPQDLNSNTSSSTLMPDKSKQNSDSINQKSNGKVTSSV